MALPDDLRRTLAVGTLNMTALPESIAEMGRVAVRFEGRVEALVLLKVAELTLKQRAGYVVHHDHRPLAEPCPIDDGQIISPNSFQHFLKMLRKEAFYKEILPEWCIHATKCHLHLPPEWLPDVLHYGHNNEKLQPYLGLILGNRGKWLAQEIRNQNWKWVDNLQATDPQAVLQIERWRETTIIRSLTTESINIKGSDSHQGLAELQQYHTVWSNDLANALVTSLVSGNIIDTPPSYTILSILNLCVYYYPIKEADSLLNFLAQGTGIWQQKRNELEERFKFRHDIFAELYQTAQRS